MRAIRLINEGSPCDIDFTDKTMQTPEDFLSRPRVICPNVNQCKLRSGRENITCTRRIAIQMAGFILQNEKPFEEAVQEEREALLADDLKVSKFWVFRNKIWQVVAGKVNVVIDDIVEFAKTIIDFRPEDQHHST